MNWQGTGSDISTEGGDTCKMGAWGGGQGHVSESESRPESAMIAV